MWISASAVVAIAAALGAGRSGSEQVTADLPPVRITTPSVPPISVPGADGSAITVPVIDVELDVDLDVGLDLGIEVDPGVPASTTPPAPPGSVVDVVGRPGTPLDVDRPGLWLIDAEAGTAQVLFTDLIVNAVSFAPDGRRAAVVTFTGRSRHGSEPLTMWVVDLQTGGRHPVVSARRGLGNPSWSPDGRWIAYNDYWEPIGGTGPEYVDAIWVVRPDGTGSRRVAGTDQYGGHYSWSPDSRWITASLYNDDRVLVAGVADGTERRHQATEPAYAEWSPAGGQLAVSTTFDGPLLVMDAVTGSSRMVATDLWGPTWSPDGAWIAAQSEDPHVGTFVLRPDGSDRRHVSALDLRDWSSDGRYLLLGGHGRGLSVLDLEAGNERAVANRPAQGLDWMGDRFVPGSHRAAMLVFP